MYIFGKRADKLGNDDIIRLVENQIQENSHLEYKRELSLKTDSERKEFLFDISAIHNTDGGCIIFGIEEEKDENGQNTGKPRLISGIKIENPDKLIQKIEDTVNSATDPKINRLIFNLLKINGLTVLVIGIPKGLGLPSMVTFKGTNKFYKRRSSGKFPVDVYELNNMFMQNQVIREKAVEFRKERIKSVLLGNVLPNLDTRISYFLHIIPFGFLGNQIVDFSKAEKDKILEMQPINSQAGWDNMYNFDGFSTYSKNDSGSFINAYNQILRSGIYEVYSTNLFYVNQHNLHGVNGERLIMETLRSIKVGLDVLDHLQFEPPFLISFSLHNVSGKFLLHNNFMAKQFNQREIVLPFIIVPSFDSNIKEMFKTSFDILWQSAGFPKCIDF